MKIIIDPSTLDCLNMGDVAMLQAAARRLREQWPDAVIQIFTNDPIALNRQCPDAQPLAHSGRMLWFSERALLGRLHQFLPDNVSRALIRLKRGVRRYSPWLLRTTLRLRLGLTRTDGRALRAFLTAIDETDLYVVSGAATMNDKAKAHAHVVLGTIEMALNRNIMVAMFSQGLGPLSDLELFAHAKRVLPRVSLIAVREKVHSPTLLKSLGVSAGKVLVTGDDAIELAHEKQPITNGSCLGVNLRVAHSSDVDHGFVDGIRQELNKAATRYDAQLIPLPIAFHAAADDPKTIRELLIVLGAESDGRGLDTPHKVIEASGKCRIVVTGAYHAAVFALAQGIPAVCLAANNYYREKFEGLIDQFRGGGELVDLSAANLGERLSASIDRAWTLATTQRQSLLALAAGQIEQGNAAYWRLGEMFRGKAKSKAFSRLQLHDTNSNHRRSSAA